MIRGLYCAIDLLFLLARNTPSIEKKTLNPIRFYIPPLFFFFLLYTVAITFPFRIAVATKRFEGNIIMIDPEINTKNTSFIG